jgi:putative FmdB family regulatory protein
MPIYEYSCKSCGHHFEALRLMKDADAPIPCRKCESSSTKRGISLCYAQSDGRSITTHSNGGCAGCSGGSCGSCGH